MQGPATSKPIKTCLTTMEKLPEDKMDATAESSKSAGTDRTTPLGLGLRGLQPKVIKTSVTCIPEFTTFCRSCHAFFFFLSFFLLICIAYDLCYYLTSCLEAEQVSKACS